MAGSPKSRIQKRMFVHPTAYHYTTFTFVGLIFLVWGILYTFQPTFLLKDSDFDKALNVAGVDGDNTKKADNKLLSDRGRLMIFVYAVVFALVLAVLLHVTVFTKM